jgi:hypothetical protein
MITNTREPEKQTDTASVVGQQRVVIPDEAKALIRFLAAAWDGADKWIWENASHLDAIDNYAMVQGTSNQINLRRIGEQECDNEKIRAAVDEMLGV